MPQPQSLGGWTRSKLIDVADRRTDRRASKKLDLDGEFLAAIQEFCMEWRWPWRRKTAKTNLIAGASWFDLTDPAGFDAADMHFIEQHGVHLITPTGNKVEVTPVFDTDQQDEYLDDTSTPAAQPSEYFIQPQFIFNVHPIPDQGYPVRISYWAVPNSMPDDQDDTIPLVPGHLHHVLCKKLELQLLRFTLGEGSSKYQAVAEEYGKLVAHYHVYEDTTSSRVREWRDNDESNFVQSTRG